MEKIQLKNYNSKYKKELDSWSDIEKQQGQNGIEDFVATKGYKLGEYIDYFSAELDVESKLAFDKDNLVGFVMYSQDVGMAHIEIMGTNPSLRGRGYAKQMMFELKEQLKTQGIDKVVFEVNKRNKPALSAFSKISKPNSKFSSENYQGMELS